MPVPYLITEHNLGKITDVPLGEVLLLAPALGWRPRVWVRHEKGETRTMQLWVTPTTDETVLGPHYRKHVGSLLIGGKGYHVFQKTAEVTE